MFPLASLYSTAWFAASFHYRLHDIYATFLQIKKELEVVEGSKDEDFKRFTNQKIKFDFSIIGRIKEAMVGLSSRCLIQALEVSRHMLSLVSNVRFAFSF